MRMGYPSVVLVIHLLACSSPSHPPREAVEAHIVAIGGEVHACHGGPARGRDPVRGGDLPKHPGQPTSCNFDREGIGYQVVVNARPLEPRREDGYGFAHASTRLGRLTVRAGNTRGCIELMKALEVAAHAWSEETLTEGLATRGWPAKNRDCTSFGDRVSCEVGRKGSEDVLEIAVDHEQVSDQVTYTAEWDEAIATGPRGRATCRWASTSAAAAVRDALAGRM